LAAYSFHVFHSLALPQPMRVFLINSSLAPIISAGDFCALISGLRRSEPIGLCDVCEYVR
jgi:hypothetical protein